MFVVGLTGGIGSGKTTVANLFAEKGITIIDTDKLARDVTQPSHPALQQISAKFGEEVILSDGALDRNLLRKIVFLHPESRLWLEQLLHPLIRQEAKNAIDKASSPYCIVVIPLLFETAPNPLIQRTLVVDATPSLQIERTTQRDKTTANAVSAILKTQISREERLKLADDIIINNGLLEDLLPQVNQLHALYLEKAAKTCK